MKDQTTNCCKSVVQRKKSVQAHEGRKTERKVCSHHLSPFLKMKLKPHIFNQKQNEQCRDREYDDSMLRTGEICVEDAKKLLLSSDQELPSAVTENEDRLNEKNKVRRKSLTEQIHVMEHKYDFVNTDDSLLLLTFMRDEMLENAIAEGKKIMKMEVEKGRSIII
jgi:hypothetical protein